VIPHPPGRKAIGRPPRLENPAPGLRVFDQGWAGGLRDLLRKHRERVQPVGDGRGRRDRSAPADGPDHLGARLRPFQLPRSREVPAAVLQFGTKRDVPAETLKDLQWRWAFHKVSPTRFLSFGPLPPPTGPPSG
jgi:hypothetical protein